MTSVKTRFFPWMAMLFLLAMRPAFFLAAQTPQTNITLKPFTALLQDAEQGNPVAQRLLAMAYLNGTGVTNNLAEAVKWLTQAAEKNDAMAQFTLGLLHDEGRGVAQDKQNAIKWYRLAAERGLPEAQYLLGSILFQGEGAAKDATNAVPWLLKAAEQGHSMAQFLAGMAYLQGEGVATNSEEAVKWLLKAAEQDEPKAQMQLSLAYQTGTGLASNLTESTKWLRRAITHVDLHPAKPAVTNIVTNETPVSLAGSSPDHAEPAVAPLPARTNESPSGALQPMPLASVAATSAATKASSESNSVYNLITLTAAFGAILMALVCAMVIWLVKGRLASLETQIQEAKHELAKANTSLATMVQHLEARLLADTSLNPAPQIRNPDLPLLMNPSEFKANRPKTSPASGA